MLNSEAMLKLAETRSGTSVDDETVGMHGNGRVSLLPDAAIALHTILENRL